MRTRLALVAALSLAFASTALAGPRGRPGQPDDRPPPDRVEREKMLRKVHTMLVVELGELLELDTAGTIKLAEKLKKYEDQRVALRLEGFDAMQQLKKIARGEGTGDAAAIARKVAANRVRMAELDQKELEEILTGLPPEKAAKTALFLASFPKRVERLAREARGGRGGPDQNRRGGPPHDDN